MSFRDSSVVVIETGRHTIRAGRGLGDQLIPAPSIEIRACVGLRRSDVPQDYDIRNAQAGPSNASFAIKSSLFLVGPALEQAEAAGEDLVISWPFKGGNIADWPQAEAIWKHVLFTALQLRRSQNEFPVMLSVLPNMPREIHEQITQIFFERFNVAALAIFERPLLQLYATSSLSGVVVDIGRESTDITPIDDCEIHHAGITSIPLGADDCENYLVHLLKSNTSVMQKLNSPTPLSYQDLQAALLKLVRQAWNDGLILVPSADGLIHTVREAEDEGLNNIAAVLVAGKEKALIEAAGARKKTAAQEKKAAATAAERERIALDLIDVEFSFTIGNGEQKETRDVTVTLGRERHSFCEPLFDPSLLLRMAAGNPALQSRINDKALGLQEAVKVAIMSVDFNRRAFLWDGVFLTGDLLAVKSLGPALQGRLSPYVIQDTGTSLHVQPTSIHMLRIPDYFAEYRDTGDVYAGFLGGCIVAKLTFTDSSGRNFVTKSEYAEKGPAAIREVMI